MAIQNFDKLNILKRRSLPYREYFQVMDLPPRDLERRIRLAMDMEEAFATFFEVIMMGVISEATVKQQLTYDIYDILGDEKRFETEEQKDKYVSNLVSEIYQSTVENLAHHPNDYVLKDGVDKDIADITADDIEPYWTSSDRTVFIAEEESNTVFNSQEFVEAKERGVTHKIWADYGDDRVRTTHQIVNGAKIPIGSYFNVGAAQMLYPRDVTSALSTGAEHPEEVIRCRCRAIYV